MVWIEGALAGRTIVITRAHESVPLPLLITGVAGVAVAVSGLVGLLGIPGPGIVRSIDLVDKRVLPTGADLGDAHGTARSAVEPQEDRGGVLGRDGTLDGFG